MIYKGSQKEGKVYKGGTKIGKIYKGSQLVYQSLNGLRLYSYNGQVINGTFISSYLIGFQNTQAHSVSVLGGFATLLGLRGTLGQSGSSVQVNDSNHSWFPYDGTFIVNNIKIHRYYTQAGGFVDNSSYLIMENSSNLMCVQNAFGRELTSVYEVTTAGVKAYSSSNVEAWTPQYDKIWTPDNIYDV